MADITLPALPYPKNGLSPHISEETLNFHYGKHHKGYVDKLNPLREKSSFAKASLEEIIKEAPHNGPLFNNSAQVWNHTFYWNCLSPEGKTSPSKQTIELLEKHFSSIEEFKKEFTGCALKHFGSGWAWLIVEKESEAVKIASTANADTPLRKEDRPVLTCDVWEHAYYIDYKNARPAYLEAFWKIINWDFVHKNLFG